MFSIVTGIAIACCGEDGKPLLNFFQSVSVVMMQVKTCLIIDKLFVVLLHKVDQTFHLLP